MSRWNGDPLIELKPLHRRKSNNMFPAKFDAAFTESMTLWAQESTRRLEQRQAGLVESNYKNASLDNAGEVNWHAVGLARVEQQYYIFSSTFDPGKY